jgi:hypothetical protein
MTECSEGELHVTELHRLPSPNGSVDVVYALVLVHMPCLRPVLAKLVRMLRSGTDRLLRILYTSSSPTGSAIKARGPSGKPCIVSTDGHQLGDHWGAELSLRLQSMRCWGPREVLPAEPLSESTAEIGVIWHYFCPLP